MKTVVCKDLGGACDKNFTAETFEEIVEMSKAHGMEMFAAQDEKHMEAMSKMMAIMQSPDAMQEWFDGKRKEFEILAED